MDVQPQTMTRPVPECLAQPSRFEQVPSSCIDRRRGNSRFDCLDGGALSISDSSMQPMGVWGGRPYRYGPGQVWGVSGQDHAEVQHDQVALLQGPGGGAVVREGRFWP